MPPSIRGHQHEVRWLKNGAPVGITTIKKFDANQKATFSQAEYVGAPVPEGDTAYQGWEGTIETEVKDEAVNELLNEITVANQNGVGAPEVQIVHTERYGDGRVYSEAFYGVQIKMSTSVGGLAEKTMKRIEFQADGHLPL